MSRFLGQLPPDHPAHQPRVVPPLPSRYEELRTGALHHVADVTGQHVAICHPPRALLTTYLLQHFPYFQQAIDLETRYCVAWAPPPWVPNYHFHLLEPRETPVFHGPLDLMLPHALGCYPWPGRLLHPTADNTGLCLFPVEGCCPRKSTSSIIYLLHIYT